MVKKKKSIRLDWKAKVILKNQAFRNRRTMEEEISSLMDKYKDIVHEMVIKDSLHINVDEELHEKLKVEASRCNTSIKKYIEYLLEME